MYNYIKKNRLFLIYIPLVLYWILIFVLTTLPARSLTVLVEISDKIKHFGAYFGLAVLLGFTLHFQEKFSAGAQKFVLLTIVICAIYGGIDEVHQLLVPNRLCEFWDWVADVSGSLIGISFVYIFIKLSARRVFTKA